MNHSVADPKLQTDRRYHHITLLKFIQNIEKLLVSIQTTHKIRPSQELNAIHEKEEMLEDQEVDVKNHLQIF